MKHDNKDPGAQYKRVRNQIKSGGIIYDDKIRGDSALRKEFDKRSVKSKDAVKD